MNVQKQNNSAGSSKRLAALDLMRSFVMILMVIDHASMAFNGCANLRIPCRDRTGQMMLIQTVKILKRLFLLTMFFVLGCVSTGHNASVSSPDSDGTILRVGITANRPPFIFKKGQQTEGLEADLAMALGDHLGKSVQFINFNWNDLIPALLDNKIDIIMSGLSVTKMRKVRFSFTEPYLIAGQVAMARGKDSLKYSTANLVKYDSNLRV